MAHAYIPGLRVTDFITFERERRLPLRGRVLVERGQRVTAGTVVARTELPGNVVPINLANVLGVLPQDVEVSLLKPLGTPIEKDEVFAKVKTMFGLMTQSARAPVKGTIESVSKVTGQAMSLDTIKASWSQMTFTFDPLAPTMTKEADNAKSVGLLDGTVKLDGIYDLSILNRLLAAAGRPAVADH